MFDTTLFNVNIPVKLTGDGRSKALVLSGCRVVVSENIPYSEFDELNYYALNCNDYGHGRVDIELSFENSKIDPYFEFFIQCVTIRTDKSVLCKVNQNRVANPYGNFTKVTKEGKIALGLEFFFRTQSEYELLMNCESFCVEGFVAFKKKTNIYGFMCRTEKTDSGWRMTEGNTYQINKRVNIEKLYH